MANLRVLHGLAVAEALSLVVLVGNRRTLDSDQLPALLGPVHGLCYLLVIVLAFALNVPRRTAWWSVVPGVGGLVVWWLARDVSGTMSPGVTTDDDKTLPTGFEPVDAADRSRSARRARARKATRR